MLRRYGFVKIFHDRVKRGKATGTRSRWPRSRSR